MTAKCSVFSSCRQRSRFRRAPAAHACRQRLRAPIRTTTLRQDAVPHCIPPCAPRSLRHPQNMDGENFDDNALTKRPSHEEEEGGDEPSPQKQHQGENDADSISVRFLISNGNAGSVIGKGGATITEFQTQSGARIQLSRAREFFPGTTDRILLLSGSINSILTALHLLLSKIKSDNADAEPDNTSTAKIVVPNACCGAIIGEFYGLQSSAPTNAFRRWLRHLRDREALIRTFCSD